MRLILDSELGLPAAPSLYQLTRESAVGVVESPGPYQLIMDALAVVSEVAAKWRTGTKYAIVSWIATPAGLPVRAWIQLGSGTRASEEVVSSTGEASARMLNAHSTGEYVARAIGEP